LTENDLDKPRIYRCLADPVNLGLDVNGLASHRLFGGGQAITGQSSERIMEPKTHKLLQQAGKFVTLGKLNVALQQYLKIHELEPGDSTIINTIADLYTRLENKDEALPWYFKLAETFEYRELVLNAIATYKKIMKISPKNQEAMVHLAHLYERSGSAEAKRYFKIIAEQLISLGQYDRALETYQKICSLEPICTESLLELAQLQEKLGKAEEASRTFVLCAVKDAEAGNPSSAASAAENVFRLKPRNKQVLKTLFKVFQDINKADRGLEYLRSLSLEQDPDLNAVLAEISSQEVNLAVSRKYLLEAFQMDPGVFPKVLNLLTELIVQKDLNASLDIIEALSETPVQVEHHASLKALMDSLIALDDSSIRTFKALSSLLLILHDQPRMEGYLRHLVILQLRGGNLRGGRDGLNQLVVHGNDNLYLDLLNLLNEGMMKDSADNLQQTCQQVIQALELGGLDLEDPSSDTGMALGVSDLDLGISLEVQPQEELFMETSL
jgi:tetratricopeptide (TPR) repeat protein